MNELEFRVKYCEERPIYEAWGQYVMSAILNADCGTGRVKDMLKIPPCPRVKDVDSIVAKAFYRGKEYQDPYHDITDKAGIRFVVLTIDQIHAVKNIIESMEDWEYSEDVDYEKNILEKPELFTYQSVHYIVRSKRELNIEGCKVPLNTPCEIQIRTLLQHAYAELSHDTVYKKQEEIPSNVKRIVARSMALIETTDGLFKEVYDVLENENSEYTEFMKWAGSYRKFGGMTDSLNKFIFTSYKEMVERNAITINDLDCFMRGRKYLQAKISEKELFHILYRQPVIYLLYYLVRNYKSQMLLFWPLDEAVLEPVFSDMGESFD